MKISVVILMVVGVVAALAAAMLVGLLRVNPVNTSAKTPDVQVLVAKHKLAAMTPIDADAIEVKTLSRDHAPQNALNDPVQAVGKVLIVPLDEGQAITSSSFAAEGAGLQIASTLKPGMRAAAINVADAAGLSGILYPGCSVDVLVAIKRSQSDNATDTISTTLLENVPVLGVDQDTIVSPTDKGNEAQNIAGQARLRKVTLMVDVQQAKALQLAQDVGVLSLALRNPLDKDKNTDSKPFSIREIAGMTDSVVGTAPPVPPVVQATAKQPEPVANTSPASRNEMWPVTIMHGPAMETKEFKVPAQ